jgi:hypothetical protein
MGQIQPAAEASEMSRRQLGGDGARLEPTAGCRGDAPPHRPEPPQAQASSAEFSAFLQASGSGAANLNQEQREALLREFLRWQESQRNARSR